MVLDLEGKVALVTGGSRGIGRAICVELASRGANVFINYSSSPAAAEETRSICSELPGGGELCQFNVANAAEIEAKIAEIVKAKGKIDILVNNAGISRDGLMMRLKEEDWDDTLSVNLKGAFLCSKAVVKTMMKNRWGRIVNISSVVGEMGNPGQAPYVASKAGLLGLTKSLAKELGSRNITVNAITPGFIDTDMTSNLPDSLKEEYQKGIPLGRFGSPQEVAYLVGFLSSDKSAYISGQVVGISGGLYM